MSIKCTVTTDLQVKDKNGYSGIQKHVEHDEKINHTNQDIVFSETQFNQYDESPKTRAAIDQWNDEHFKDYVEEHDKHQREKGHAERQYGSVKNYLKRKKKATAVLTIGNMEVQSKLMQQFCPKTSYQEEKLPDGTTHLVFKLKDQSSQPIPDNIAIAKQFYGCFNRALIKATNNNVGWTLKDKSRVNIGDYLHRGRYATNNDEMGISHIHYELATFGMTRGGKKRAAHVTNSLNQALVSLHHAVTGKYCSGRDATKWFRANMDQFALKCLEDELHKTYKVPQNKKILDFERKTKEDKTVQTGLSMEQLKAQHQEIADHQKAVQSLQSQADNLTNRKNDVQSQVATVTQNLKSIYEAATGHQAVDKDGKDLSPLAMANGITKAARSSQKDKEKAEQAKATADQERQKAEQQKAQQEQQLATQRQQLKALQDQLDEANNQLKRRKQQRIKNAQKEIAQNELTDGNNQPINVTEDNVAQIEQELDEWREEERNNWEVDKQNYQDELDNLTKELTSKRTEKADLTNTNQQLNNQNQQFQNDNQIIQKQINGYKNQLVDTIAENAPEHKVESSLLKPNETAQPVISDTGRQQHLRQTLKYLMDTTTKVLQKIKTEATNFINQITQTLTQPHQDQQSTIIPTPQHSPYLDLLNIKSSDKPFNHRTEKKLMNDPGIKLKKAILFATNAQLQKTSQQTKQSLKKQAEDEYEL
ncbi:coiled-coil domain-containing protein [Limosilactobacillus reuteri]|uniref:replication protein n=1 Tax=Limosilactobacillus reuteri TaxID=1598 RepID=UPI00292A5935|nr:replication protein [Limosilactobacillus reuteri]